MPEVTKSGSSVMNLITYDDQTIQHMTGLPDFFASKLLNHIYDNFYKDKKTEG